MAVWWSWVWEPMLFVTIGSSINFSTLDTGIIPNSLIIICTGAPRPAGPRGGGASSEGPQGGAVCRART